MAKHRIDLVGKVKNLPVGNSMSANYSFDGENLTIGWKGELQTFKANIGESYIVDCWGGVPNVYKFQYPKNPFKLLRMLHHGASVYTEKEIIEDLMIERNKEYRMCIPQTDGLHTFNKVYLKDKFEYTEQYQAEGTIHKYLYISNDLTLGEFKSVIEKELEKEAILRLPKNNNITFLEYAKRFD